MKNLFLCLLVIIMTATSCAVSRNTQATVTTRDLTAPVIAATIADLEVSEQKISYTYTVPTNQKSKQITVFHNVNEIISFAISEALKNYGDADVLVEPQTTIVRVDSRVSTVTVTGYPAKYKNFRNADNETLNKAIENGTLLPGSPSIVVQK